MPHRLCCYTLFDITNTGVLNRAKPPIDADPKQWLYKRNTQTNFDTVLQAISLRSQPEIITAPIQVNIRFDEFENFGFLYEQLEDETYPMWKFEFEVQHTSVFENGLAELGALYNDCEGIPMLKCGTEWDKLPTFLDTSPELRNIYFTIL